jgi:murein DD-endopeptidase MepM/ murein hydrolase activator NlpD
VFIALVAAVTGGTAVHTYYRVRPLFGPAAPATATAAETQTAAAPAPRAPDLPIEPTLAPLPMIPQGGDIDGLRARRLAFPVEGFDSGQVVDTYDQARDGRRHEALDILATRGTPVLAVEDGRVEKLFTSQRGGLTVYQFDPTETYCYYYAHLDRYETGLQEKQIVRRGDRIGYVGATGNADATAPHLHFAIFKLGPERHWWEGTPLNPYSLWRTP